MKWKFWKQRRYIVSVMAFLALFNVYSVSSNLTVAMLGMTEIIHYKLENGTIIKVQDFDWNPRMQGFILSSYYYGNLCSYFIGGWLATRYGSVTLLILSMMFSADLTLGTPEVSKLHKYALIVIRVFLGCAQGLVLPCINLLWTKWAPASEGSRMSSFAVSGCFVGNIFVLVAAGMITQYWGWPAVFYITGLSSIFFGICIGQNVKDDPADDSRITKEELLYIQESIGIYNKEVKIPWKNLLTSMPVWAVFVAHFCANWGFYTLLTQFPLFLFQTTEINIKCIGIIIALPYLANAICLQFSGVLIDRVVKCGRYSLTKVRKIFVCTSFMVEMIFIILAAFIHVPLIILLCIIIATSFDALAWSSYGVNFLDIGTPYAGILMGISSKFALLPGILTPLLSGELVTERVDRWCHVFFFCGAIYLFGAIFYGIFGSAELQDWAKPRLEILSTLEQETGRIDDNTIDETNISSTQARRPGINEPTNENTIIGKETIFRSAARIVNI